MANEITKNLGDKTKTLVELIKARKQTESQRPQEISEEQKRENVIKWTTFFRRNWNLYAELWLHIKLHPFQHIMLYMIGVSQVWFAICSRGLSKSFIVALSAMIKALLYPYSEIHITAKTLDQAKKMINDKMKRELCNKLSPVLKYYYENGLIKFTITKEEIKVDFLMNGSTIWVDVADDSSRGKFPQKKDINLLYD